MLWSYMFLVRATVKKKNVFYNQILKCSKTRKEVKRSNQIDGEHFEEKKKNRLKVT